MAKKHSCTNCGHKWDIKKVGPFCPKCELKTSSEDKWVSAKIGK
jgi:hypothetical protein